MDVHTPGDKWSPRVWHRRASRPVSALVDAPFPAWQLYLGVGIELAIWAI